MGYTDEQLRAIDTRDCDLLVSAAAGSGKTSVLVERIIRKVTAPESPVDIDTLLVVTFTEAAASEMRQRISDAVLERLNKNSADKHLRRQLTLLNRSSITTIHSFCLSVVRENCHLIDIDPNFRIADPTEISLLKAEIMDELFEEQYGGERPAAFHALVESYSENTGDNRLSELVLEVYDFIQSSPRPFRWLHENAEKFNLKGGIEDTVWADIIKEDFARVIDGVREAVSRCIALIDNNGTCDGYLDALNSDLRMVDDLSRIKTLEEIYGVLSGGLDFAKLKTLKKDELDTDIKEEIKGIRADDIKKPLGKIKIDRPDRMESEIKDLYPVIKTLCDTVELFDKKFKEAKKEKLIADFNDLEHFCLEILLDENDEPTETARELKQKYNEVMIDEYQDSNLVQEYILSAVSRRDIPNRFMVGDIKQCIYKFRLAEPALFMKKYNSYLADGSGRSVRIDLSKNFRSRKGVLDAVNFLFRQLMTEEVGEVCYDDSASLKQGRTFSEGRDENTELHLIETGASESCIDDDYADAVNELTSIELEAAVVAGRINKLFEDGFTVCDKNGCRPIEYRDIVILLRSTRMAAPKFYDILTANGIPAFADGTGGFFQTVEIMTILSLVRIIDNPRQDIHLVTVLNSPIYGVDVDELAEIRTSSGEKTYYDCLKHYMSDETSADTQLKLKLEKFFGDLSRFKRLSLNTPISELLWVLYDETNYYNYVGMLTGGGLRQGNLTALFEKAVQYENTSLKGLFHFVKYIERLERKSRDFGEAKILSENENLVRIMSIHKSKGLEFPVVFVSMLGKKFNMSDTRKDLLLHQDLGFGPNYVDYEKRFKKSSIAKTALIKKITEESLSEELRILYVALTRAKEKLILTGAAADLGKKITKWVRYVDLKEAALPAHYMLNGASFLDWVVPSVARHKNCGRVREEAGVFGGEGLIADESEWDIIFASRDSLSLSEQERSEKSGASFKELKEIIDAKADYSGQRNEIYRRLSWAYAHPLSVNLPSKVTISEIKRQITEREAALYDGFKSDEISFKAPVFIKEKRELSPTEKGTALHTLLEHIDVHSVRTRDDTVNFIDELVSKNILAKDEAESLNIASIVKFLSSKLSDRMRQSSEIKREVPFVMSISPSEYDGDYKAADEKVLLHGIIDCYFEEDGGIVLVDYKSDYVRDIQAIKDKYKIQLEFYKKAVENSTGMKVKQTVLYLFAVDEEVVC